MKDKKGVIITNVLQNILDESNCKLNKIWVDKCSEFYSRSMKLFLKNSGIEIYSTQNKGKSVLLKYYYKLL